MPQYGREIGHGRPAADRDLHELPHGHPARFQKLAAVRESYKTGTPIPWVKVHDIADYVYFNHSAHVSAGVGCAECHGRVDQMEVVETVKPLNMGWCLDCHRDPGPSLRPKDQVTNMQWPETAD